MSSQDNGEVPWSMLRRHLDEAPEAPWPDWIPPKGPGTVTPLGFEPVEAEHLGAEMCLALKVGDIVGVDITDDLSEITYVRIGNIRSFREERLISYDYGAAAHQGRPDHERLPVMRLLTSVYRPYRQAVRLPRSPTASN